LKGIPEGRYTREFRHEAVRLVAEERPSLPEAARRLSLSLSTRAYWVKAYKTGKPGESSREYHNLLRRYGNVMPGCWQHETLLVHY
jgi:transposase-like protein